MEDETCMALSPLSRKEKQKLRKKLRRKRKRQQLASAAVQELEPEPTPEELAREKEEHDRLQKEWELREQLAQLEWRKKQEVTTPAYFILFACLLDYLSHQFRELLN